MTTAQKLREAAKLEHCYNALLENCFQAADELDTLTLNLLNAEQEVKDLKAKLKKVEATAQRRLDLLREVEGPLSDCAAFGSCDCDIPNGKTCLTCQIAMLHKAIAAELKESP